LEIVISGMDLTNENIAVLTYDMEVLSPEHTPYSGAVHKNIAAFNLLPVIPLARTSAPY